MTGTGMESFERLLSPFTLRGCSLRNRIVLAPMSTQLAGCDGSVSEPMIEYYSHKAAGGAAAVITETFHVDDRASRFTYVQPSIFHDRYLPGMSRLAEAVKRHGALAIAQVGHAGRQTTFEVNECQPVAPSKIRGGITGHCHELSADEIEQIIEAFAAAAVRAQTAGFQGVEVHGGNGYLIHEFLSPLTNRRTDWYGEQRELFLRRIVQAIAGRVQEGFIIGVRIGFADFIDGGLLPEEAIRLCLSLPVERIGYFHTSAGTAESDDYRIQPIYHQRAIHRAVSAALKERTRVPILLTGSVNDPVLAEELLAGGAADLIGMGRPLLADSALPGKLLDGRAGEVRPCIRCNEGCLNRVRLGRTIRCAVNPLPGYGHSLDLSARNGKRRKRARISIAGAGPAGITAALRAAELGCDARLFEAGDEIGGLLHTARHEPFKQDIRDYLVYMQGCVARAGIEVVASTRLTAQLIQESTPDLLINATGSLPVLLDAQPDSGPPVVESREYLNNLDRYPLSRRVIIIGGGSAGCELGYTLSLKGSLVSIIEQAADVLPDLDPVSALALKRLVRAAGIQVHAGTRFLRLGREGVITDRFDRPLEGDLIVLAMGSVPNRELDDQLEGSKWILGRNYLRIGDARRIGRLYEAVHETYRTVSGFLAGCG